MDKKTIDDALSAVNSDKATGIKIAIISVNEGKTLYAGEIPPGQLVRPHYHPHGDELYIIIEGHGLMYIERPKPGFPQRVDDWGNPTPVYFEDFICIREGEAHCLHNNGTRRLVILFYCQPDHLTESNRVFVEPSPVTR